MIYSFNSINSYQKLSNWFMEITNSLSQEFIYLKNQLQKEAFPNNSLMFQASILSLKIVPFKEEE